MKLFPIGLGTFPFSNVFGSTTESEVGRILHAFLDSGGNYIQTAPYYEGVDALVGRLLKKRPRSDYVISTLAVKDRDSRIRGDFEAVVGQCDDSLRHLQLEHIDIYMTSTPEGSNVAFGETVGAMEHLQRVGKIREIGVCNVTLEQLKEYNASGSIRYVQNRFSLIDQEAGRDVRAYCVDKGIGLIPYNIIEWGLLTNRILEPFQLREGDLRTSVLPVFGDDQISVLRCWARDQLQPIATKYGTSIESLAICWAITEPGVVAAPVGATRLDQLHSSMKSVDLFREPELRDDLGAAYRALVGVVETGHQLPLNDFLRNSFGKW